MLVLASAMTANGCTSKPGRGDVAGAAGTGGGSGGASGLCSDVTACAGSVVGTWAVASSCLTVSGNLDPSLASFSCTSVPIAGSLQVTGTLTLNADGTYSDATTTSGTERLTLAASCLVISSTPIGCDQAANALGNLGYASVSCATTVSGGCDCSAIVQQTGGIGLLSTDLSGTGTYTAPNNVTLTGATSSSSMPYTSCVTGDTMTWTPQSASPSLSGTVTFQRQPTSTGSAGTQGGGGGTSGSGGGGGAAGAAGASGAAGGGRGGTSGAGGTGGAAGRGGAGGGKAGASGGAGSGGGGGVRPCDVFAAAGTPCVAAHSTVRALFAAYDKPLYQVKKVSDGSTKDVPLLAGTGVADASVQDAFCGTAAHACTISIIYDQTGNGNDLKVAHVCPTCSGCPADSTKKGQPDVEAFADGVKITIAGHPAYGVHILPCGGGIPNQTGYRCDTPSKTATGDQPESVYFVVDGVDANSGCCFDYGNASTTDTASGNMDAVEFSKNKFWGYGAGSGPWVAADLEAGVYAWNGGSGNWQNPNSQSLPYPFVTALLKSNQNGKTGGPFVLKAGDGRSGSLAAMWNGARPSGYATLNKGGGIVLGIGGDNASGAAGNFFEGALTASFNSDATDDALQANIVAAGYGK
jgi:hypothetical protein